MRSSPGSRAVAVALLVLAAACEPSPSPPAPATPVPPPVQPAPLPPSKPAPPPMHPVKELLEQVKRECSDAFQSPDAEERRLQARLDDAESRPEADDREWAALQADAAKSRERDRRLKSDPRYQHAETRRNWDRLLDRKIVTAKDAPESSRPSTDAPQGWVEDDASFVAKWKAAHAGR